MVYVKGMIFAMTVRKFLAKVFAYYYFCRRTVHYLLVRDHLLVNLSLLFNMHYSPAAKKHKFLNELFSLLSSSIRFCNIFRFCMA